MLGLSSEKAVRMFACLILVILLLLFLWTAYAIPAQALDNPCEKWDMFASYAGLTRMEWVGYPQGWQGFPDDTQFQDNGRVEFEDNSGIWAYESKSTGERFVFYFWDMTVDGNPPGLHHLCGPYQTNGKSGFSVN